MTYIEFFDKVVVENICGSLVNPPARVVLVGDSAKTLARHSARYEKILLNRGFKVEFVCRSVNRNNLQSIVDTLADLVELYSDCVFDLTGGDDLFLVAVGIINERYRERHLKIHRFNILNGTIIDCDQDGKTIMEDDTLQMTVEENVTAYGGAIVYRDMKVYGTEAWDMNREFQEDIWNMWDICRQDVREWNSRISVFSVIDSSLNGQEDSLTLRLPAEKYESILSNRGLEPSEMEAFIRALQSIGLITVYSCGGNGFSVSFKNGQVKRCLVKAGQALEMLIYMAALNTRDNLGNAVYNDVMNGVVIDWDGEIHPAEDEACDTENEIDVVMMHGIVPVFVSCKNGSVEKEELYKLNSVAERFGGEYAKKVLIATALEDSSKYDDFLRQRAKDMNIRLVEGLQGMTRERLEATVRSFWCNP